MRQPIMLFVVAGALGCSTPGDERVQPDTAAVDARSASPRSVTPAPVATPLPAVDSGAPRLLPRDEADAAFRSFRSRVLERLSARDTSFLYGMLAPDIKNSFGGDDSIAGFKRIWRMAENRTDVWEVLSRVLQLGGKMPADSLFIAPYVYAFWPDSIDAFEHVAVVTPNALLREAASASSRAIGTLSHSILKLEEWQNLGELGVPTDSTWARVRLRSGRTGWVQGEAVYSPVDWRAFFIKRNGRWMLQLFVAGD